MDYRFGEKIVRIMNACPATRKSEIYKKAGYSFLSNKDGYDFLLDFQLRESEVKIETIELKPGDTLDLPATIARELVRAKGHRGLCIVDPANPLPGIVDGLQKAIQFFGEKGHEGAVKAQLSAGHSDEQRKNMRSIYQPFDLNVARQQILEKHLQEVEKKALQATK